MFLEQGFKKKIADTYTTIIRTVSTHADKIAAKIEFGKKQTNKKKTQTMMRYRAIYWWSVKSNSSNKMQATRATKKAKNSETVYKLVMMSFNCKWQGNWHLMSDWVTWANTDIFYERLSDFTALEAFGVNVAIKSTYIKSVIEFLTKVSRH